MDMHRRLLAAGAIALACTSTHAALIQMTTRIGFSGTTGSGGFEPGVPPDVERGVLTLVYDTATPDMNPAADIGLYANAIQFVRITIEQTNRPDLDFVLAPSRTNEIQVGTHLNEWFVNVAFDVRDLSGAYATPLLARFGFATDVQIGDALPGIAFWQDARGRAGFIGRVSDLDAANGPYFAAVISMPGTLGLVAGGLLLAGMGRRRSR